LEAKGKPADFKELLEPDSRKAMPVILTTPEESGEIRMTAAP
jgi:hypothetical protein